MVNTVWFKADHGLDFHPLADYMTKLRNFTEETYHDLLCNAESPELPQEVQALLCLFL